MMEINKKNYIAPRALCVVIDDSEIIATSTPTDLTSGGDNDQPGAPTTAESKGLFQFVGNNSDGDFNDW